MKVKILISPKCDRQKLKSDLESEQQIYSQGSNPGQQKLYINSFVYKF